VCHADAAALPIGAAGVPSSQCVGSYNDNVSHRYHMYTMKTMYKGLDSCMTLKLYTSYISPAISLFLLLIASYRHLVQMSMACDPFDQPRTVAIVSLVSSCQAHPTTIV
jgi:hypothetical protein